MSGVTKLGALWIADPERARKWALQELERYNGDRIRASTALGVHYRTLVKLLHDMGLWDAVQERWPSKFVRRNSD